MDRSGHPNSEARILVVEDESLIAMMIEDALNAARYRVVGPFGRVAKALSAAESEPLDGAILDWNVAGESVVPVAEVLRRRGVPVLIVSGYGEVGPDQAGGSYAVLSKPFSPEDLVSIVQHKLLTQPAPVGPS